MDFDGPLYVTLDWALGEVQVNSGESKSAAKKLRKLLDAFF